MMKPTLQYVAILIVIRTNWAAAGGENYRNYFGNADLNDLTSLSELPIEKLLILRQTLKQDIPTENQDPAKRKPSTAMNHENRHKSAGKDKAKDALLDRTVTDWGYEEDHPHGLHEGENMLWLKTKGNVQAIFQTTVTVLAFLAFGGYLVCLILITFKGGPQGAVVVQTTSTTATDNRIKKVKKRNAPDSGDTHMYALCQIAEGYAKYHILIENYNNNATSGGT